MDAVALDLVKLRRVPEAGELLQRVVWLSLNDAAYQIWRVRSNLQGFERAAGILPPLPDVDLTDWSILRGEMQAAYRRVAAERHNIEDKPAYRWLRLVRPRASRQEVLDALAAIWKLEDDFQRHSRHLKDDDSVWTMKIHKAMARVRADNPMFSEETFSRFETDMLIANR